MAGVSSGSGSTLSPENEPHRTVKADPCSLTRAFLDSPELQARGFDTTGATVGNWYLSAVGSSTPAARFRCPRPSAEGRRTSIRKTFRDRLTRRNSGDLVRQPLSTWTADRHLPIRCDARPLSLCSVDKTTAWSFDSLLWFVSTLASTPHGY